MKALVFWFVVGAVSAAGEVVSQKTGQRLSLKCTSSNFKSLSWYHGNDRIITVNGKNGMSHKGTAHIQERTKVKWTDLEIYEVKKEDAGKFICNVDGNSQEFTLVVVSVWATPPGKLQLGSKAMLQCEVAGLPSGSPVQWTRPDNCSHEDSGTVHLSHVTHSDAGTWVCVFSYDGKTFRESLDIKIEEPACEPLTSSPTQSSKVNQKKPCTNFSCDSPGDTDHVPIVGLHDLWVWVAVGVGSFFVVLLMVCIIVLCRRNKRRKRKLQRMKNERPRKFCHCNCPTAVTKTQQGRQKGKPSALPLKPQLMQ